MMYLKKKEATLLITTTKANLIDTILNKNPILKKKEQQFCKFSTRTTQYLPI